MPVRELRISGLILLPESAGVNGAVVRLEDGSEYAVGPALYRVKPATQKYDSVLGGAVTEGAVQLDLEYVPYQQWPPGVELDNAMLMVFSEPLATTQKG
jgi:hypothetical protein